MQQIVSGVPRALAPEQERIACDALHAYLAAPADLELEQEQDCKRVELIESTLKPLLKSYLQGSIPLAPFKRQIDGLNKQHPLWGFKGIKGQMFFNMLTNAVGDQDQYDVEFKAALRLPSSDEEAAEQLRRFKLFVVRTGEHAVGIGGGSRSKPKPGSIPFFVSYFWQIQRREIWPVYYTSTVRTITDLNLWQETGDIDADYVSYKRFYEALVAVFSEAAGRQFSLYDVGHVFWFKSGKQIVSAPKTQQIISAEADVATSIELPLKLTSTTDGTLILPDTYVPPIVAVIPRLAINDPEIGEAARRAGTTVERAFEKSCNAAFTVLGYETKLLGQGMGRVPDGQAVAQDESYGILWDAKVRAGGYNMGTDDRTIREYIATQSRDLKRRGGLRNIYYLIISSGFTDDFDDLIRSLKMDTNVNEVCLLVSSALVEMVDQKLRSPLTVSLGPDGLQRLFSTSGIITAPDVSELLV
jgi:hypothetical protein